MLVLVLLRSVDATGFSVGAMKNGHLGVRFAVCSVSWAYQLASMRSWIQVPSWRCASGV